VGQIYRYWLEQPSFQRIYTIYAVLLLMSSLMYSVRVIRLLRGRSHRKQGPSTREHDANASAADLARLALAGQLNFATSTEHALAQESQTATTEVASELRSAENEFSYLWDTCSGKVISIKKLFFLNVLVSLFVVTYEVFPAWNIEFNNRNVSPLVALHRSTERLFGITALGLFVSIILYSISAILDGILMRRKTNWQYFSARLRNGVSRN
jgi:hypothetical protein